MSPPLAKTISVRAVSITNEVVDTRPSEPVATTVWTPCPLTALPDAMALPSTVNDVKVTLAAGSR